MHLGDLGAGLPTWGMTGLFQETLYIFNRRALLVRFSIMCVYGKLCVFLPFGCLLYYIYIYVKAEKGNTVWFPCRQATQRRVFFFFFEEEEEKIKSIQPVRYSG